MIPSYLSIPILAHVGFLIWAFRALPLERWMVLAAIPVKRVGLGEWECVNLTYYGLLSACGAVAGVALALFLAGAVDVSAFLIGAALTGTLAISVPASRWMNRLVEGHADGFTIGGAAFVGILIAPWVAWLAAHWLAPDPSAWQGAALTLGALAPAYALGEGIGRLACISFGCCYGRRMDDAPVWMRKLFKGWAFVFEGPLKKAETEQGWGDVPLVPVQGLTAIVSGTAGWIGAILFLRGYPMWAAAISIVASQLWRFASEFLRADYRGGGRISAYQWMALSAAAYMLTLAALWPGADADIPDPAAGSRLLTHPLAILFIAGWGLLIFLRMGVSTVTYSIVHFQTRQPARQ